jgi:hypothetical protein
MKYYRNKKHHSEVYTWDEKLRHEFSGNPIIVGTNGVKWEFGSISGITNRDRLEEFIPDAPQDTIEGVANSKQHRQPKIAANAKPGGVIPVSPCYCGGWRAPGAIRQHRGNFGRRK